MADKVGQFTQYEDSFIWDLFNQIAPLLLDMRRPMFRRGLEAVNSRTIEYFDNVNRMFYRPDKNLDSEMVLCAVARWYVGVEMKCPEYIECLLEFIREISALTVEESEPNQPEYWDLIKFAINEIQSEHVQSKISLSDSSSSIQNIFNGMPADLKSIWSKKFYPPFQSSISYTWTGNSEDLSELQFLLNPYIESCTPENFKMVFQGKLPTEFKPIIWKRNANELAYLIVRMMELGLILMEDRLDSLKLDSCFIQQNGKQPGNKWRFHKQALNKMKKGNRELIDVILFNFQ
ncbi:hypothetical protein [Dyadobacter frigoris]|uniref:Uncharacterized protein n=1 Tax=Dyadobacter frigoris TaxID=2576211 RepID=A0A4V6BKF4_9BACT|nr:hypothetical protein [Dyadobacter frigoris]TKT92663.1 hypothetical protein FDK13_07560 [Dyadobacter frigoris]